MKIKCIIIDDEPLAIKVIENHLQEFQNFEIVGTFNNPIEALQLLEEEEIDAVFLDINMSKMNGLEFIKNVELKSNIVITTAYREYAVESFDLDVLDYLVKPIPFNRFLKAVNKITQRISQQRGASQDNFNESTDSFIFLKVDKKLVKILFDEIYYIESLKDYIKVFTATDNYLVHKSLTGITEELPSDQFLRVHRSYTISLDKVKSVEGNSVEIDSKRIPIGRKYINQAKQIILNIED
jgi:DNA-binding LytR/AlgR family response regulator